MKLRATFEVEVPINPGDVLTLESNAGGSPEVDHANLNRIAWDNLDRAWLLSVVVDA